MAFVEGGEARVWCTVRGTGFAVLTLGIEEFLVFGCCVGGPFILKLRELAAGRVVGAVLEQPAGITGSTRVLVDGSWTQWGGRLPGERDGLGAGEIEAFATAMRAAGFAVSVTRDQVRSFRTPMLVLPGVDARRPAQAGREIAALAPAGELLDPWKDPGASPRRPPRQPAGSSATAPPARTPANRPRPAGAVLRATMPGRRVHRAYAPQLYEGGMAVSREVTVGSRHS